MAKCRAVWSCVGREAVGLLPVPAWGWGAGRAGTLRGPLQNQHHFAVFFQPHGFCFHILEKGATQVLNTPGFSSEAGSMSLPKPEP